MGMMKNKMIEEMDSYCGECGNPYPAKCPKCHEEFYNLEGDEKEYCPNCDCESVLEDQRECYCETPLNWDQE